MPHIRFAGSTDFDQLCTLFNESHDFHHQKLPHFFHDAGDIIYKKDIFDAAFTQNNEVIVVAELEDKIIGAIYVTIHNSGDQNHVGPQVLTPRKFGFVRTLVVDHTWRHRGIGHQLLAACEKWVEEQGVKEIELVVWDFNQEAKEIYMKDGYGGLNTRMYKKLT